MKAKISKRRGRVDMVVGGDRAGQKMVGPYIV